MSKFRRIEPVKEQNFYKRNYVKATEIITPKFYLEEDKLVGGEELDVIDEIINTHINIANKYSSVILSGINGVSSINTSPICSGLNTISGLSKFFIKQNNLTDIDFNDLEKNILLKSGRSLTEFETSAQFRNYLITNLLPSIVLNKPTIALQGVHPSSMHEYLVTNLSWIYLLNVDGFSYDGSTIVADAMVDTLWYGEKFQLNTGIKCLTEYIFRNFTASAASWFPLGLLPTSFLPNIVYDDPENTSGLQQLEKLKTLVDIIYSPNYFDRNDTKVKEAFNDFINTGSYLSDKESQGPFYKYLKAVSYAFADYANFSDTLELLNDVNKCPDEYLPYLADLLGWTLLGTEPLKWRLQLLNALSVYRSAGTKKALQFILDSTFSKDSLQVSSEILEMWESYIPHLIYYSLATESTLLKDFTTWTQAEANRFNINYIPSSLDQSIRCVVDEIIFRTSKLFNFRYWYNGKLLSIKDPELVFNYRGRDFKVPPFEEYQYYLNQNITTNIVAYLVDQLECFGVTRPFAEQVGQYILSNSIYAGKDISMGYSWLIFTSGVQYPPNWDSVILDISNKKSEFLSLWNGKSSHFKMFFETGRFDFTDDNLVVNSKQGLRVLADLVEKFSPAHSIPQIFLKTSATDDMGYSTVDLPYISLDKKDHAATANSDSYGFKNYEISGYNMNLYKRGLGDGEYLTSPNYIWRDSVDSIIDSVLNKGCIAAPRKSFRRRNYKTTINDLGLYDRSGFNMPTTFKNYVKENSYSSLGFLPLGLIPSSQQYVPIPDYNNIPLIYNICESLNSKNIFSGLVVSSTFPCRGLPPQERIPPAPDNPIDVYLWFGDSLAGGVQNTLSAMDTYYTEINKNVSGTYTFIPSAGNFQLTQPGKNSGILQITSIASAISPHWTFGYELYKKHGRNSYIIQFSLPNSYGLSAPDSETNLAAGLSPLINDNTVNDWDVRNQGEALSIYKNWITSAIDYLTNLYGDRVVYRGAVSYLGTNYSFAKLIDETYPEFVIRYINSLQDIKTNVESFIKSKNIYKGHPIWIMSIPDYKYRNIDPIWEYYIDEFRLNISSLISKNNNLYLFDPPSNLSIYDNFVHYDGSSNLSMGSSIANLFIESRLINSRFGYDPYDYTNDRGQLDNILNVMFYISEYSKDVLASAIINKNVSSYVNQFIWKDVYKSLANELTEDDTKVYFNKNNFKFGKDIHKLYNDYCDYFNRYKLLRQYVHLDGPTIFGHIFGSIFKNSDFTLYGSSVAITPQIVTSSLDTEFTLKPGSVWFPASGGGVYNAFLLQPSSFRITPSEVGNSTILDGVDLIHTVGAGSRNHFTLFDLGKQTFRVYSPNKSAFVVDNNILRISSKSNFGLPRVRYDIKSHVHKAKDGYPLSSNLLIPEHEFTLELATLLASDDFKKFGRGSLGVFIHTGYENSGTWVFTPNSKWEFTYTSAINNNSVKSTFAHKVDFGPRDGFDASGETCLVDLKLNSMYNLSSVNFDITRLKFNTKNKPIRVPEHYYKIYQQVHRPNQNYYVEVFLYPNQEQNLYLDYVSLMDSTLNKWSQFLVSAVGNPFPVGDFNCQEFRLKLDREHLYHIFKYFTEVTGDKTNFGKSSRISTVTASTYGAKGGSKLNYVIDPDWTAGKFRLFNDNLLVQLYIEN